MKLILTDYIASLKEEKELDALIESLLKECGFEVAFGPKKGERQYGVDIYAVGEDWEDGVKKLFLITVKQGNLDRKNWEGGPQAIQPSLQNIVTVFIRNNIAPGHASLPIKIIVAHNGVNDAGIQQNWKGMAEIYPAYEFVIWQLETIVNLVLTRLINENLFSDKAKRALRKIIIFLADSNYDFEELKVVIDEILENVDLSGSNRRHNLNSLRKINLLLAVIISYCEQENDLRLALKATEITVLRLWQFMGKNREQLDQDVIGELLKTLFIRKALHENYLNKILPVCDIKDGLSRQSHDPVNYIFIVYEQLGFIALAGLEFLQLAELFAETVPESVDRLTEDASACCNGIVNVLNNNRIVYNPKRDDHIIEITLCFLLFHKLGRTEMIEAVLQQLADDLAFGKMFFNFAPHFHNNTEEIFELQFDSKKRKGFDYQSTCLFTVLIEWCLVTGNPGIYRAYTKLKDDLFKADDLILWFPDDTTETLLYTKKAHRESGYSLSGMTLPESYEAFKEITLRDYVFNSQELEFTFFKDSLWIIGLISARHYRTYVFPVYWRQLIGNSCEVKATEKPVTTKQ